MDGTMFNTEDIYDVVGQRLLSSRGHCFTRQLKMKMMGLPGPKAIQVMKEHCQLKESIEQLAQESDEVFLELLPHRVAKMPGLDRLLEQLERIGLPKAIATSSQLRFAKAALSAFDLLPRFEFVLTAEDVTEGKPHPEIYLKAAKRFNIATADMLVIEDSVIGSTAAAASGAVTVAIPANHSALSDFRHADLVLDRIDSPVILELIREDNPPPCK